MNPTTKDKRLSTRAKLGLASGAFAVLALGLFCYYPENREDMFRAMPEDSLAACCVRDAAAEDRALLRNPAFQRIAAACGEDPDEIIDHNDGLYWTLYALTGRDTVLSVAPCDDDLGVYAAGVSYVGWKARILELLWRMKYVPGLGAMKITEQGTRYLEFDDDFFVDNNLVLAVDMENGVLVAALTQHPDRVNGVVARLRAARTARKADRPDLLPKTAAAFADDAAPWKRAGGAGIVLWANAEELPPLAEGLVPENISFRAKFDSFRKDGIAARVALPFEMFPEESEPMKAPSPETASLPVDAGIISLAISPSALASQEYAEALVDATGAPVTASLYAKPYTSVIALIAAPTLLVSAPVGENFDFAGTFDALWNQNAESVKNARLKREMIDQQTCLVRSKKLELLGDTPRENRFFARQEGNNVFIGSGYGAYGKLRAENNGGQTLGDLAKRLKKLDANAIAAAEIDCVQLAELAPIVNAVAALAGYALPFDVTAALGEGSSVTAADVMRGIGRLGITVGQSNSETTFSVVAP